MDNSKTVIRFVDLRQLMYKENFNILFQYGRRTYAGRVYVSHAPGFYYYSIFLGGKQILFFVDDEQDQWVENNKGNTRLADIVGEAIDKHYHPGRFLKNPPIDPE